MVRGLREGHVSSAKVRSSVTGTKATTKARGRNELLSCRDWQEPERWKDLGELPGGRD